MTSEHITKLPNDSLSVYTYATFGSANPQAFGLTQTIYQTTVIPEGFQLSVHGFGEYFDLYLYNYRFNHGEAFRINKTNPQEAFKEILIFLKNYFMPFWELDHADR